LADEGWYVPREISSHRIRDDFSHGQNEKSEEISVIFLTSAKKGYSQPYSSLSLSINALISISEPPQGEMSNVSSHLAGNPESGV
jgi:hypothetical protein